ncbi:Taste receptor type 1 member 3 [Chytriomyces hyalinus]|nr:Taste receptor type 1 member 3 [Chytriomyces hyalinus]
MKILHLSLAFAGVGAYAQAVPAIPDTEYTNERLGQLTLGLVNMYCLLPNITCLAESESTSQQIPHHSCTTSARIDTLPGFSYFFDLAARLAIEHVNSDSSILPGIHVGYRRFSNCGNSWSPELADSYSGDSAGYAGSEMVREILEDPAGVVGTVGFEFSRTVMVAAEVLSHYKIPHCSASAGSPRFSNKNKYPYFWRMVASADVCDHVRLLLEHWGVKRVAMIRERNDELGFNGYLQLFHFFITTLFFCPVGADILETFRAKGIQISAKIDISGKLDDDDAVYAKSLIVNTQSHYIFVSGQADFTASVLYRLGKLNITGSEFVFIGFTAPLPFGNPLDAGPLHPVYGPDFFSLIEGYVMAATLPDSTNPRYKEFNNLILSRTQVNTWSNGSLMSPDFDFVMSYGMDTAYDCTMVMLMGIEKVVSVFKKIGRFGG